MSSWKTTSHDAEGTGRAPGLSGEAADPFGRSDAGTVRGGRAVADGSLHLFVRS